MLEEDDNGCFDHKGLRDFWTSGGVDLSGIRPDWKSNLRRLLAHLDAARNLEGIRGGLGRQKDFKPIEGQDDRYELEINGNYRLTFTCSDPATGVVRKLNVEDVHRKGGAKRY